MSPPVGMRCLWLPPERRSTRPEPDPHCSWRESVLAVALPCAPSQRAGPTPPPIQHQIATGFDPELTRMFLTLVQQAPVVWSPATPCRMRRELGIRSLGRFAPI